MPENTPEDARPKAAPASGSDAVVWNEDANGFTLFVTKSEHDIFVSYMAVHDDRREAQRSKEGCLSLSDAKARCYGMMALRLEIWMLRAQEKMREHRNESRSTQNADC